MKTHGVDFTQRLPSDNPDSDGRVQVCVKIAYGGANNFLRGLELNLEQARTNLALSVTEYCRVSNVLDVSLATQKCDEWIAKVPFRQSAVPIFEELPERLDLYFASLEERAKVHFCELARISFDDGCRAVLLNSGISSHYPPPAKVDELLELALRDTKKELSGRLEPEISTLPGCFGAGARR